MTMKAINKILLTLAIGAPLTLSSCLDETFPTDEITSEQLEQSSKALDSAVGGIPSYMKTYGVWSVGDRPDATDFAYPAQMIIRDVMCQDMIQVYNNYQHFINFQRISVVINQDYLLNQIVWYYYNLQVKQANDVIGLIDPATASALERNMLAQALTFRAFIYLDMARMYEWLPNEKSTNINSYGNDIAGLTVPISDVRKPVDELDNPRATHKEMFDFILSDLDEAEGYFMVNNSRNDKTRPNLSVVYGLKARLYMWDENYPKAAEYARLAKAGYTPLTKDQWLNPNSGFNDMNANNSWMFAIHQSKEDACVNTTYSNWTSFMSSEGDVGYACSGDHDNPMVADVSFYNQISNRDWRKLSWVAPAGSELSEQNVYTRASDAGKIQEYATLKFRNGQGNMNNSDICWATDIPLMRVEEMMLIEAEAEAHSNPAEGKRLLEEFMKTRNPQYQFISSDMEDVIDEIFFQKRVEFWGEGIILFDFKRLNKSVIREYDGSNWPADAQFNTNGRPGWLNFTMCGYEGELNKACEGMNNPDVGGTF